MSSKSNRLKTKVKWRKTNKCTVTYQGEVDLTAARPVPGKIDPLAEERGCWRNVEAKIAREGGKAVSGWLVYDEGRYYRLGAHTVWEDREGNWWDITPGHCQGDPFVPDPRAGPSHPVAYKVKDNPDDEEFLLNVNAMHRAADKDRTLIETGVWN